MPSFFEKKQPQILHTQEGANIAYHAAQGKSPGVIFLGGFHSDMNGTKAIALAQWCFDNDRAFLRFDYSGHGASSGQFEDGCIGDWATDALSALDHLTQGPQVLVGSSMGGWISLLVARARPERVVGILGVAAAPDFTEDLMWKDLNEAQRGELINKGKVCLTCDYNRDEPYIITKKLIEDGQKNLLLQDPLDIHIPVRLIQGLLDADVPWQTALKLQDVLASTDVEIQFIKNGDHRLSEAKDLLRLTRTLEHLLKDVETA